MPAVSRESYMYLCAHMQIMVGFIRVAVEISQVPISSPYPLSYQEKEKQQRNTQYANLEYPPRTV